MHALDVGGEGAEVGGVVDFVVEELSWGGRLVITSFDSPFSGCGGGKGREG